MKKLSILLLFALFAGESFAQKLTAYFSYCSFRQPEGSSFIETYLSVLGNTVKFLPNSNQKQQSKIEIQWLLKSGDKVIYIDKYNLLSPELNSETDAKPNFLDQQRIAADNGKYLIELTISDKNAAGSKYTMTDSVTINYPDDKISISDIELLESYSRSNQPDKLSKSGYHLVPNLSIFFPKDVNTIKFYAEFYNSTKQPGEEFLVRYYLVNEGNKQVLTDISGFKKMQPQQVNVLIAELPLEKVSSGNYSLIVEARNKNNELLARKASFFQRSNPITEVVQSDFSLIDITNTFVAVMNTDSMKEYVSCLYPIANANEKQTIENVVGMRDVVALKQFMYYFWSKRDAQNPAQKWSAYKEEVNKVNKAYSTLNKKGYDADRGRVYLQYGPPNTIDKSDNQPDTYPYEVWHYYTISDQTNRKFVFYERTLSTNNYELLHSDVTGEPSAYDWQVILHGKINQFGDIDKSTTPGSYGDRTNDSFINPK